MLQPKPANLIISNVLEQLCTFQRTHVLQSFLACIQQVSAIPISDTLNLHDLAVFVIQQIINCLDDFIRQGLDVFGLLTVVIF